jgi:type I restriction enzyme S subunit
MRTSDLIAKGSLAIGDGYRAKNSEMAATGLPFVRIGDLREDFQFEGVDLLSPASCAMAGNKISRHGDCIVSTKGTVGRVLFVPASAGQFVYSPQLSYWRVLSDDVRSEYLICWMRGPDFVRQCATVKGATDMADYVNLKDQRRMLLPIPTLNVQRAFAELVQPMLDLIANLWRSSANLRSTRQQLLHRLVSGAVDVTDLDIEVPEAAA